MEKIRKLTIVIKYVEKDLQDERKRRDDKIKYYEDTLAFLDKLQECNLETNPLYIKCRRNISKGDIKRFLEEIGWCVKEDDVTIWDNETFETSPIQYLTVVTKNFDKDYIPPSGF